MAYLNPVRITLEKLEIWAKHDPNARVVYSTGTCWWKVGNPIYRILDGPGKGIPCDPRGAVLMECNNLAGFLQSAKDNPEYYGKHGLKAFLAAYHGNVLADNGLPTSLETWQEYNDLIDEEEEPNYTQNPMF